MNPKNLLCQFKIELLEIEPAIWRYDFGDGWEHSITVMPKAIGRTIPTVSTTSR